MAIMYLNTRQYVKAAVVVVDADLSTGSKILMEPGAMLLGGRGRVITAAGGTSPTLSLVDNASSPTTIINAQALGAVATFAITTGAGNYYPAGAELTFSVGGTSPTGGKVLIELEYIIEDAQNEVYGRSA